MNQRTTYAMAVAVLLQATGASAQTPPALLGKTPEGASVGPLALSKVHAESVIAGFLAQTTLTLTFRNDRDETLEGELTVPLPDGATVSGFALDVDGELVDGVIVERHEARIAFESESRRRIDPGLVEWVRGNTYRTRVYPVPAHGGRTIRLRYVEDLGARGRSAGGGTSYRLPLSFGQAVDELSVRIDVDAGALPRIVSSAVPGLSFQTSQGRAVASVDARTVKPTQDIVVALTLASDGGARVVRAAPDEHYFVIEDLPAMPGGTRASVAKPRRVALLFDASQSSADARDRELRFLEQWLSRAGELDVDVVVFRDVLDQARSFTVSSGRGTALLEHLRKQPLDGATRLAALRFPKNPNGYGVRPTASRALPDYDYALLVSDGLSTLGAESVPVSALPVYAVSASRRANHAWLRRLADQSGGRYLDIQDAAGSDAALAAIGAPVFSLLAVEFDPTQVADVLPGSRRAVEGRVLVGGRLLAPEASVRLVYGYRDGTSPWTRSFTLRRSGAQDDALVARLWAQQQVAELQLAPEQNRAELLRLGSRFQIVTPGTSLLVLETVDQYVFYGIEPPRSRAGFYEQYAQQRQEYDRERTEARAKKHERVAREWAERVLWWNREFRFRPDDLQRKEEAGPTVFSAATAAVAVPVGFAAGGSDEGAEPLSGVPVVTLKPWDPETRYLAAMKRAGLTRAYEVYLEQRVRYRASPSFYLDCADFFFRNRWPALARRVLTNVLELGIDDPRVVRVAAHRLRQAGEWDLAVELFEKARRLRPEEPQSHRDLALALEARADARREREARIAEPAAADYARALELLDVVVSEPWDERFDGIEVVALMEANRILGVLEREGRPEAANARLAPELRKPIDADVRVVLSWDTDATDMDLQVLEPTGEECSYSRTETSAGGTISQDLTGGYGPEEYAVRRALPGTYRIKAHYYGSAAGRLAGPTIVQATVITDFGRRSEKRRSLTLRLTPKKRPAARKPAGAENEDEDEADDDTEGSEETVEVGTLQYASLAESLSDGDAERRRMAVALVARGDEKGGAAAALRPMLKDASGMVRVEAASALWRLSGCPRCPEADEWTRLLRAELANPSAAARLFAASRLDAWGRAGVPELGRLLADSDPGVARFAVEALARIGNSAIPALRPLLASEQPPLRMRGVQALVLMLSSARDARSELAAIAERDADPGVRDEASRALRSFEANASAGVGAEEQAGAIRHAPIGCLVEGQYSLVDAQIEPAAEVARARVYFKTNLGPMFYFVEMERAPLQGADRRFVGRLPKPRPEASPIHYYIMAIATDGTESQTREYVARVVATESECPAGQRAAVAVFR